MKQPIYLSGVRMPGLDTLCRVQGDSLPVGLLVQPATARLLRDAASHYSWLGIDNGCFSARTRATFTLDRYARLVERALATFGDFVLFVAAPDVPFDWAGTLRASLPTLATIRSWGAPAALVLQDGATPEQIPWSEVDAVFVGGSTAWKAGPEAEAVVRAACHRGVWVHMGRVNSMKRLTRAAEMGCDSADGTYLLHAGPAGVTDLCRWAEGVEAVRTRRVELATLEAMGTPLLDPERRRALELAGWL